MRIVVHLDMDAFYAAVEERLNPALGDLPVVVGADPKKAKAEALLPRPTIEQKNSASARGARDAFRTAKTGWTHYCYA